MISLRPLVEELKTIRKQCMEIESEYQEKKGAHEKVGVGVTPAGEEEGLKAVERSAGGATRRYPSSQPRTQNIYSFGACVYLEIPQNVERCNTLLTTACSYLLLLCPFCMAREKRKGGRGA